MYLNPVYGLKLKLSIFLSIFFYSGNHKGSLSQVSVKQLKLKIKEPTDNHLNECPELLCGLSCDHSLSQTSPVGNSPWGKEYFRVSLKS